MAYGGSSPSVTIRRSSNRFPKNWLPRKLTRIGVKQPARNTLVPETNSASEVRAEGERDTPLYATATACYAVVAMQ